MSEEYKYPSRMAWADKIKELEAENERLNMNIRALGLVPFFYEEAIEELLSVIEYVVKSDELDQEWDAQKPIDLLSKYRKEK